MGFMNEAAEQVLANFRHEIALSQAHAKRADGYLTQFLSLVSQTDGHRTPQGASVRCVREWTRWLSENGPELKAVIAEETGIKFSERGTPYTFLWDEAMADDPDDALPANAICRMQGPPNADGKGRPPMVYFLWSQRWDVHPRFGVGPTKPDVCTETHEVPTADNPNPTPCPHPSHAASEALTGVIRPPVSSHPINPANGEEIPIAWGEVEAIADQSERDAPLDPRCASMEQWDDLHAPLFDAMVTSESKPTDEQKDFLRATLPDGAEPNAAIAIAYRNAVARSRGT